MNRAALVAAGLLCATGAGATALDAFTAGFGEDGVAALAEHGYVLIQGKDVDRRISAAHWKALEALSSAALSCKALLDDFKTTPAPSADIGIAACRSLPSDGVATARVQAVAAAVEAEAEERWALVVSSAGVAEPADLPNLFDTPWGRTMMARRRADRFDETAFLAKDFFHEYLSGVHANLDAIRHFIAVETARGISGVDAKLSADAVHGALSDELRAIVARYLLDERRRHGLFQARERLKSLAADKAVRRDMDSLNAVVSGLTMRPNLLNIVESAVSSVPAPAGVPRLRSAGVHLQEPTRLGQYELGDEARVSGAYWVDGLAEDASTDVAETMLIETARGFASAQTQNVRRRNGGPYVFERRIVVDETKNFAVVALISASSGTLIAERAEVHVAPDFELALKKEADALHSRLSCEPKTSGDAYAALEGLVVDAAKAKPQYKALLDRAREGHRRAEEDAVALSALDAALVKAKSEATGADCRFDPSAADAAIKLARKLPAGCDKVLPELFASRHLLTRRAADQSWFTKAAVSARAKRHSCDFSGAAHGYSEALAVLDADPAARCGKIADDAKIVEAELPLTQVALAWDEALSKSFDKAEAETVPAKRLELVRPALARIAALDDRACRRDLEKRGERLELNAGADEGGPSSTDATLRLPADGALKNDVDEVLRARNRMLAKSDAAAAPMATPTAKEISNPEPVKTPLKKARKKIKLTPPPSEPVAEPLP